MYSNAALNLWAFRSHFIGLGMTIDSKPNKSPKSTCEEWSARSTATLAGYPCLKHNVTDELTLFGRHGEVFEVGNGEFGVRVWSIGQIRSNKDIKQKILNRYGAATFHIGEEALFRISANEIGSFIEILGIPRHRGRQLTFAKKEGLNRPGKNK